MAGEKKGGQGGEGKGDKGKGDWGKKYGENIHLANDCYAKNEKNSVTSVIKRQTTRLKMDKKFEHLLLKRK